MKCSAVFLCAVIFCGCIAAQPASQTPASRRIVIAAGTLFDGKGGVLHNTRIVIEGTKIMAIDPQAAPVDYDLRGLTVLPGWIDAHVHITWSFDKDGKNAGPAAATPEAVYRAAGNAWVTLLGGFTTVQSVGSAQDFSLRDAISRGSLPGRAFSPPVSRFPGAENRPARLKKSAP